MKIHQQCGIQENNLEHFLKCITNSAMSFFLPRKALYLGKSTQQNNTTGKIYNRWNVLREN
jgi:hypothetical protein